MRLGRRERLLGAFVGTGVLSLDQLSGLDFVAVRAASLDARPREPQRIPVVVLVDSPEQVAPARAGGVLGVVAMGGVGDSPIAGTDAVLSDHGRARWATSPAAARAAFADGAQMVVYDLTAMTDALLGTLPEGKPMVPPLSSVVDAAARQPFVLLSGMLGDASLWDELAGLLNDVVMPWPARIDLDDSVVEMAASVLAEAPARFALGGHSLGAIVALEVMRQAPQRVTRLVLFNASGRGPSEAQQAAWAAWRKRTEDGEFDEVATELAAATLPAARRQDESLVHADLQMARAIGGDGFVRQLSAQATRPDSLSSVGAITVPVLVVSGELDEVCPPALQRELVDHCPAADLATLPHVGHMAPLEAPGPLAELLRRWFTHQ